MRSGNRSPIMKSPRNPVRRGQRDPFSKPYKVRDLETWGSIARDNNTTADSLIWFNFDTANPDEVNWYLHHYVGCKNPSHDGFNWKFSKADNPGIIYLPINPKLVGEDIYELPSNTELARALDSADFASRLIEPIHIGLDVAEFTHIGLEMAKVELGELIGEGAGFAAEVIAPAVLSEVLLGMALGMGHMEAITELKEKKARLGIGHGIVLGAAGESAEFVKSQFVSLSADFNTVYPEQRKNLQNTYLSALSYGIAYGRKLNKSERLRFFRHLDSRAGWQPAGNFYLTRERQSAGARKNYYSEVATYFLAEVEFED